MTNVVKKKSDTDSKTNDKQDKVKENKKPKEPKYTVLEKNGYTVGKSLGSGAYATVKVVQYVNN